MYCVKRYYNGEIVADNMTLKEATNYINDLSGQSGWDEFENYFIEKI